MIDALQDAPRVNDVDIALDEQEGLGAGTWYYRVTARYAPDDLENPGGESLPSDPLPLIVPEGLDVRFQVALTWADVPDAVEYHVYRTPTGVEGAGQEQRIATVPGDRESYLDTGDPVGLEVPPVVGDLGNWATLASLGTAREGLGLGIGRDPDDAERWYLYAIGGRAAAPVDTYEYLRVDRDADDRQSTAGTWTSGGANVISSARWQLGAFSVDTSVTNRVAANQVVIFAGPGRNAGGGVDSAADSGEIQVGGALTQWRRGREGGGGSTGPPRAGYGAIAASNQLFAFGGQQGSPSDDSDSAGLCGAGANCATVGTVRNWNSTAASMTHDRFLMGATVGNARIFLVGGDTGAGGITRSVESTLW